MKVSGKYFISVLNRFIGRNGWGKANRYESPFEIECLEDNLLLQGSHVSEFNRQPNLSNLAINRLFDRQQLDKMDYFGTYLKKNAVRVKNRDIPVHANTTEPSLGTFSVSQIVFIVATEDKWTKVEYVDKSDILKVGWVKDLIY